MLNQVHEKYYDEQADIDSMFVDSDTKAELKNDALDTPKTKYFEDIIAAASVDITVELQPETKSLNTLRISSITRKYTA